MRAFLLYIDDWLSSKSIAMMDDHEERAYFRLLLHEATDQFCSLPDDPKQLSVLSGLGYQWFRESSHRDKRISGSTSGEKISRCFLTLSEIKSIPTNELGFDLPLSLPDNRLYNVRLLREWVHQQEVRAKRSEIGRRGGIAKAIAKQLPSNCQANGVANTLANGKQKPANDVWASSSSTDTPDNSENLDMSNYTLDESFQTFKRTYEQTGAPLIDTDWAKAYFTWRVLDFEQKADAIAGVKLRIETGRWSDPAYVMKPQNYLENREWKRKVVVPKRQQQPEAAQETPPKAPIVSSEGVNPEAIWVPKYQRPQ